MVRFRVPRPPYWLSPPDGNEIDFYLKDYIHYKGDCVENPSSDVTEKYTRFLNQPQVLHIWDTITYTTIPLPIIVSEYHTTSTRMPQSRKTVQEVYRDDYAYTINYPYSPVIVDVLGRYHPLEFLDLAFPNWRQMTARVLNEKLDQIGPVHLRLRHRRCTVFGIAQVVLEPREEHWLSDGIWQNIPEYLYREWAVRVKNPNGPYVYIKNEPGSLYPIDLVHNLEEETEEETRDRIKLEKSERWHALLFIANRIARAGQTAGYRPKNDEKIERLARRFIQIVLNS